MKSLKIIVASLVTLWSLHGVAAIQEIHESESTEEQVLEQHSKKIVRLAPNDFKPVFTKETVLKLNAIVRRSYNAINEYDSIAEDIRMLINNADQTKDSEKRGFKKAVSQRLVEMKGLRERSKAAMADMVKAITELENSREYYNKTILAGMVEFVEKVDTELAGQKDKLAKISG
jgi:hypothetical protein